MKIKLNVFTCPNKNKDGNWITNKSYGTRVGFYCLWGVEPTKNDTRPRDVDYGTTPAPWDSPMKSTDRSPYITLIADLIEKGTDNIDGSDNNTSAPHTPSGAKIVKQLVEPSALNSEGGNVGLVDGSITWRKQRAMRPHYSVVRPPFSPNASYIGYW